MRHVLIGSAALVLAMATTMAQSRGFSGTWKLDRSRSQMSTAGLAGLGAAGFPETLHVTQAHNGTVVVESQMNESQSRIYRPAGKTTTPAGEGATITMTSQVSEASIVSEGARTPASGGVTGVKEVHSLSADGQTLTIAVTASAPGDTQTSTLVFTRIASVGSCTSWPTPCKFGEGAIP